MQVQDTKFLEAVISNLIFFVFLLWLPKEIVIGTFLLFIFVGLIILIISKRSDGIVLEKVKEGTLIDTTNTKTVYFKEIEE